jgi:integrase/recombinase XerD
MTETALTVENNLGHNVLALKEQAADDLIAMANLYYQTRVRGQADNTEDAKRRDIALFLNFYYAMFHHTRPRDWHASVTREFIKQLRCGEKKYSRASIARIYASIRHFAKWAHASVFAFPFGCPTEGVKPPEAPKGDWKGLTRQNELRLLAAARTLQSVPGRGINQGVRDYAVVTVLLGTGLRVSELLSVDVAQWNGRCLRHVAIKGGEERSLVPVRGEAKKALDAWLQARGAPSGALFLTQRGNRLGRKQFWAILKRVERLANAHLPDAERFTVTPHVLRHTLLRKLAEVKGVQYAMAASGHKTDRYIWRYVQPGSQDLADAIDAVEEGDSAD